MRFSPPCTSGWRTRPRAKQLIIAEQLREIALLRLKAVVSA